MLNEIAPLARQAVIIEAGKLACTIVGSQAMGSYLRQNNMQNRVNSILNSLPESFDQPLEVPVAGVAYLGRRAKERRTLAIELDDQATSLGAEIDTYKQLLKGGVVPPHRQGDTRPHISLCNIPTEFAFPSLLDIVNEHVPATILLDPMTIDAELTLRKAIINSHYEPLGEPIRSVTTTPRSASAIPAALRFLPRQDS